MAALARRAVRSRRLPTKKSSQTRTHALRIEALELRRLLSGDPTPAAPADIAQAITQDPTTSAPNGNRADTFSVASHAPAPKKPPPTPPAAPTNLQASEQNGQVTLHWTLNSSNQTGFVVECFACLMPAPQWTTLATVGSKNNSYTFTPPSKLGPTVEYEVFETNIAGSSPPSNAVTVTMPPAPPTGLSTTASNGRVTLTWTGSLGAASYDVYRGTSSGQEGATPIATGLTAATLTDSNVTGGTTYYYTVTAVDAAGQSPMSNEASAMLSLPPAAPSGLAVSAGSTSASLAWNAVSGATGYDLYRGTSSGDESFEAYVTGTSFTDTGLAGLTTYYYQVSAVNSSGQGGWSSEVSATTGSDWFAENLPDAGLQTSARGDFNRDGTLTYNDVLGLLSQAVSETGSGTVSAAVVTSLQALASASGASYLNLAPSVQGLLADLADGGQCDYLGTVLNSLTANATTASELQDLVNKWFLGEDLPTIDTQYWSTSGYALANQGTLFGTSGAPLYTDIYQGEEGDCWLCASFAEVALKQPSLIQTSFTDDGLVTENGVQVHVWTYSYYEGGTREYMTLNNYFPSHDGEFMYLDAFQNITNTSNVLWAPLMEKAYAGIYGDNYASLNGGYAQNVLPLETGGTAGGNVFGSESSFISAVDSSNSLLTLSCWSSSYGLISAHDYAVISYDAATQTFQLYNPWGFDQPGPLTWAQLQQCFTQDANTVVSSAAPTGPAGDGIATAPGAAAPLSGGYAMPASSGAPSPALVAAKDALFSQL